MSLSELSHTHTHSNWHSWIKIASGKNNIQKCIPGAGPNWNDTRNKPSQRDKNLAVSLPQGWKVGSTGFFLKRKGQAMSRLQSPWSRENYWELNRADEAEPSRKLHNKPKQGQRGGGHLVERRGHVLWNFPVSIISQRKISYVLDIMKKGIWLHHE